MYLRKKKSLLCIFVRFWYATFGINGLPPDLMHCRFKVYLERARAECSREQILSRALLWSSRECSKKQTEFFAFRRFKAAGRRIILNTLIYMSAVWGKRYCRPVATCSAQQAHFDDFS